jgi:hypothetical protein
MHAATLLATEMESAALFVAATVSATTRESAT